MSKDNDLKIKIAMLKAGVKGYEVAHEWGMSESKFSRILRNPSDEQTEQAIKVIERLEKRKQEGKGA